jgi:hypothetical protein
VTGVFSGHVVQQRRRHDLVAVPGVEQHEGDLERMDDERRAVHLADLAAVRLGGAERGPAGDGVVAEKLRQIRLGRHGGRSSQILRAEPCARM